MNKQPEVTARTRQRIIDAFWSLSNKYSIEKMTVGEIAKEAKINRGTFYNYFLDIVDLVDSVEEQLIESMHGDILKKIAEKKIDSLSSFSNAVTQSFIAYGDKEFYLLSDKGDSRFQKKLQKTMKHIMCRFSGIPENSTEEDYIVTYACTTIIGMVKHWYESGKNMKEEDLISLGQKLIFTGIWGYTKNPAFPVSDK